MQILTSFLQLMPEHVAVDVCSGITNFVVIPALFRPHLSFTSCLTPSQHVIPEDLLRPAATPRSLTARISCRTRMAYFTLGKYRAQLPCSAWRPPFCDSHPSLKGTIVKDRFPFGSGTMFDQNWPKRHMLANQASKGGGSKKPSDLFDELPALHARQGLGSNGTAKSAKPTQPVCSQDAPICWEGSQKQAQETQSARSASESGSQFGRQDASGRASVQGLGARPPVPSPAVAQAPPMWQVLPPEVGHQVAPWPAVQPAVQPVPAYPGHMATPVDAMGLGLAFQGRQLRYFTVMCKDDVEIRASPTYADDARVGHFLHPGQVLVVDDRRMVNGSCFLHLADGRGWVFETKDRLLVMTEVQEFERGLWHYCLICEDDVETRISPTYSDDARTGMVLLSGDCIAVDERCTVANARFLKLADGRGWVFEMKDRLLVMSEVRPKAQEARDFARGMWHYTVVCDSDVEIRAAPTYSDEARTGLTVHPGDCIAIDERCRVNATWFLRLADGRGWLFESKDSRRVMMQLH
eukprot:s1303_g8.t2